MAFPTGWQRRLAITIDETLCGTADSTNFTVLLTRDNLPDEMCSPSDANRAQADGGDIRFSSDTDGVTQLALHVERWEQDSVDAAADADIALNVKVPTLSASTDTVIYAWYKTSGTDTQPAATDTYGSQNAYDADHCSVWTMDEAVADTPPEFKDVVGARHLAETYGTAVSVAGKNGGAAVDTNASAVARGDYAGFLTPLNAATVTATNTGLCYIPVDDRLAFVNFDDNEVIEVTKAGVEVNRWAVTEGETQLQGLAYDSVADQFIIALFTGSTMYVYDRDGTFDRTVSGNSNAVCYDSTDDALWVRDGVGAAKKINKTTGATISSITYTGTASGVNPDGICHNSDTNTLFISDGTNYKIHEINKTTGATIQTFPGPLDIEHLAYDTTDEALWVNGDARYHSGANLGQNVIYKLTTSGDAYGWKVPQTEYTVEFWHKPDSTASTTILYSDFSSVTAGFYRELQCRAGALRIYATNTVFANGGTLTAGTWRHIVCRYLSSDTTLRAYVNAANTATVTGTAVRFGPDGHMGIGGRPSNTNKHNGSFDDIRLHRVARSGDWITARYNNSNDPGAFAAAGTPEAASNPQTATPGVASLTISTFAVNVSTPILAIPGVASLTLTSFVPTISTPQTVTPDVATLTLSAFAPTIQVGNAVEVTADTATLTLTTFAPVAQLPQLVTPGTLTLILQSYAPEIVGPQAVTIPTASLVLTTYQPTINPVAGGDLIIPYYFYLTS